MDKKSFILYVDYQKHFSRLSDAEAGQLIKAIFDYAAGCEIEPILSPAAGMAFSFIRDRIDIDSEKFELTCQKRSEAGKKGMATRWKNTKAKQAITNDNNVISVITSDNKAKQAITKITDNDNDNDILSLSNDNDNIEQDCTAPVRAAQPAQEEESVIPWDELDPDEWV